MPLPLLQEAGHPPFAPLVVVAIPPGAVAAADSLAEAVAVASANK